MEEQRKQIEEKKKQKEQKRAQDRDYFNAVGY